MKYIYIYIYIQRKKDKEKTRTYGLNHYRNLSEKEKKRVWKKLSQNFLPMMKKEKIKEYA